MVLQEKKVAGGLPVSRSRTCVRQQLLIRLIAAGGNYTKSAASCVRKAYQRPGQETDLSCLGINCTDKGVAFSPFLIDMFQLQIVIGFFNGRCTVTVMSPDADIVSTRGHPFPPTHYEGTFTALIRLSGSNKRLRT